MNKAVRKAVIAGNWKMNKTPAEAKELITAIAPLVKDAGCDVVACVPYVDIAPAIEAAKGTNIKIGAENCHWAVSGAFTGEISAEMLKACGVEYVITGHSERRTYFGDTDVTVQKRTRAALDAGLTVIVCVGEYLEQREKSLSASSSLMSRYGPSAPARPPRQNRQTKFALSSVRPSSPSTAKRLQKASPFSTAAP